MAFSLVSFSYLIQDSTFNWRCHRVVAKSVPQLCITYVLGDLSNSIRRLKNILISVYIHDHPKPSLVWCIQPKHPLSSDPNNDHLKPSLVGCIQPTHPLSSDPNHDHLKPSLVGCIQPKHPLSSDPNHDHLKPSLVGCIQPKHPLIRCFVRDVIPPPKVLSKLQPQVIWSPLINFL